MFCIDASVIISAAHDTEIYSEASQEFLSRLREEKLKAFLPELVMPEIASGLLRATKNVKFAYEFVDSLRAIPNFAFVPLDRTLSDAAVNVIIATGLKGADAVYVALALNYNLTLVTLDKDQLLRSRNLIAVRKP